MFYAIALILSQASSVESPRTSIPAPAPSASIVSRQIDPGRLEDNEQTFQVERVGNWSIRVDKTLGYGCYGFAVFDDGTLLRIMANPLTDQVLIGLANSRWRSLQSDEKYFIEVQFDSFEPWEGNAGVTILNPTLKMLNLSIDGAFLDEMGSSRVLLARYEDRSLARLDMTQSKAMLSALASCQNEVEDYIDDPFN